MADIEKEESSDRVIERWSLKDGLIAIPFLASALALTWEVGYFLSIGGGSFGLFSLAEHITFAVQALPAALAITTLAAYAIFFMSFLSPPSFVNRRSFKIMRQLVRPWFVMFLGVLFVFFITIGFGILTARGQMQSTRSLNIIKVGEKGKEMETEFKVRILRTGERGVLYFNPATQSFGLLPWDSVKRIDWAISPLVWRK